MYGVTSNVVSELSSLTGEICQKTIRGGGVGLDDVSLVL